MNEVFLYRCFSQLQHPCHVDLPLFSLLSTSIAQTGEWDSGKARHTWKDIESDMYFHTRKPGISGMPHSATLILLVNTPQYIAEKGLFMGTEWESHGGWGKALNRNGVGKWRRKEGRSEIKIKRNGAGQCCIETYCFVNQELEGWEPAWMNNAELNSPVSGMGAYLKWVREVPETSQTTEALAFPLRHPQEPILWRSWVPQESNFSWTTVSPVTIMFLDG